MAQAIFTLIPNLFRMVANDVDGTVSLQVWDSSASAWKTVQSISVTAQNMSLGTNLANYLTVAGAANGSSPAVQAAGSDTNVGIRLVPKGTGRVSVTANGMDITGTLTASTSIAVGGGTPITKIAVYTPSLTPASVAAQTTAEQTFTVTGLNVTDKVVVNGPAPVAGTGIVNARVSAVNTLAITFVNVTAGALTPAAGTYTIIAFRS